MRAMHAVGGAVMLHVVRESDVACREDDRRSHGGGGGGGMKAGAVDKSALCARLEALVSAIRT
jgi:hypothetical protein